MVTDADPLLRKTLLANAVFSVVSGSTLLLAGPALAPSLPGPPPLLRALGAGLVLFGVGVGALSRQRSPLRPAVTAVSLADGAWVVGSVALLVLDPGSLTAAGRWAVAGVAVVVATFGVAQYLCLAVARQGREDDLGKRIALSWRSMKTWVKVWLFFLNGLFLGALFFLETPVGRWVLLAYLTAAPLLAAIVILQRGLTRLLGVAHLVPWTPLVAYLALRLVGDGLGPRITPASDPSLFGYVVVLLTTLVICLGLDVYDVLRWLRGKRYVLGTREAERAGASRRTLR